MNFYNKILYNILLQLVETTKQKCRPFMFVLAKDNKLWFSTNNTKDVYKDMLANPEIEISTSSPSYAWIRLNGKAVFENNMAAKEMCMGNPIVKRPVPNR